MLRRSQQKTFASRCDDIGRFLSVCFQSRKFIAGPMKKKSESKISHSTNRFFADTNTALCAFLKGLMKRPFLFWDTSSTKSLIWSDDSYLESSDIRVRWSGPKEEAQSPNAASSQEQ